MPCTQTFHLAHPLSALKSALLDKHFLCILAILTTILHVDTVHAQDLLVSPTGEKLCLIYYHLAKIPPPLSDFANSSSAIQNANEFRKPEIATQVRSDIESLYNSLSETKVIRINIEMSLGIYDTAIGEFALNGFGADEYISFNCFGKYAHLRLRFDNSPYAQSWALDPKTAAKVLERNNGAREITAVSTIDLVGAEKSLPGDPLVIIGHVRNVSVLGRYNHAPLGSYNVPEK